MVLAHRTPRVAIIVTRHQTSIHTDWQFTAFCRTCVLKLSDSYFYSGGDPQNLRSPWWNTALLYLALWQIGPNAAVQANAACRIQQQCEWHSWFSLTHWGRVMHICVVELTVIGSDNGLSPGRRQAIIWTNAGILLIEPLGTNFSEILIGIEIFSCAWKCRLRNGIHFVSASMC